MLREAHCLRCGRPLDRTAARLVTKVTILPPLSTLDMRRLLTTRPRPTKTP